MKDLKEILSNECYGRDLKQRKHWYSPTANAYDQVRPRYPQTLVDQVVDIAQLSSELNHARSRVWSSDRHPCICQSRLPHALPGAKF